ncbi:Voltage-gated potassium channel subunit beta-3 [Frankliniella fusca]|uniref:Voltage-gated potassium channel subunit beta-3 n=1 Tax=Frankliniella fusca TaxID=407009 RepID=A0AAE1L626_9NEOP|nr:Voltage-gated potassium channel subunit beta-3 [Frankliniella fusca]
MSQQDIFASDDENVDDPDEMQATPTEFSGVSASSSHDSPAVASQSSQSSLMNTSTVTPSSSQPIPSTPSPGQSPSQVIYACPITPCKSKILKTLIGFKKHLANQHQVPSESIENLVQTSSRPSVVQSAASRASTSTAAETRQTFLCSLCKSVLNTEDGYLRHQAAHRYKDATKKKPKAEDFTTSILLEAMTKIISEILEEPCYENISGPKKSFLEELQAKQECPEFMAFAETLSEKVCVIVCEEHKKLMPLNQYEESQQKFHAFLFKEENISDLRDKLISICQQYISTVLANRLVFRLALKLFWEVQLWMSKETRNSASASTSSTLEPPEMSNVEKEAFAHNVGEILRSFYKKCLTRSNKALTRSACISDKFVDGQHPIASACLLDKGQWFTGDEDGLVPSENAINFFYEVQRVSIASIQEKNDINVVTDKILDNYCALNFWFHLTSSHFTEEDSLLFMKDLIKTFTRHFCERREKQQNRAAEKAVAASRVPLRQDFNRNVRDKADTVESVTSGNSNQVQ